MKNPDLDSVLRAALDTRGGIEKEIASLESLKAETAARLATLEVSCDLGDAGALGDISRSQVLAALLPRRLSARLEAFAQSEKHILEEAHSFISKSLIPRLKDLLARARTAARASLQPHFSQEKELSAAVESSALVSELTTISNNIKVDSAPYGGAVRYAESLLDAWRQADVVESKLS